MSILFIFRQMFGNDIHQGKLDSLVDEGFAEQQVTDYSRAKRAAAGANKRNFDGGQMDSFYVTGRM